MGRTDSPIWSRRRITAVHALGVVLIVCGGCAALVVGLVSWFAGGTVCTNWDGNCSGSDWILPGVLVAIGVGVACLGVFLLTRGRSADWRETPAGRA